MGIGEIVLLAVGLAMDAFAVAICKGLASAKAGWKEMLVVGLYFGLFQAGMPLIGYFLGVQFQEQIVAFDHWIAFGLLTIIGINMIREALSKDEEPADASLSFRVMVVLALATSIDALAIGVSFAFLQVDIWLAVAIIGTITFGISMVGVKLGNVFGCKYRAKAELAGGIILILIGLKILLEHLGILVL